jgi:hypothetical protein
MKWSALRPTPNPYPLLFPFAIGINSLLQRVNPPFLGMSRALKETRGRVLGITDALPGIRHPYLGALGAFQGISDSLLGVNGSFLRIDQPLIRMRDAFRLGIRLSGHFRVLPVALCSLLLLLPDPLPFPLCPSLLLHPRVRLKFHLIEPCKIRRFERQRTVT